MRLLIALFIAIPMLAACSSLRKQAAERSFQFDRKWARHTISGNYLGPRQNHRMSPLLFGEYVLQGNAVDGLRAYKKTTGAPVWQRFLDGGVEAGAALSGSTVLFGANDGFFYALDAYTGRNRWSFPIKSEGLGAPTVDGGVVFFVAGNNTAYAINVESGEQLWFYTRMESTNMTVRGSAQPTIVNETAFFGFSDGSLVALNKNTGTIIWERQLGSLERFKDIDARPMFHNGRLYVTAYDGQLYALNPATGATVWSTDDGGFTTPVIQGGTLFTATSLGEVVALELSSGKRLWAHSLGRTVSGGLLYHRGLIVFGEWQGDLVALDATNGKVVQRYSTGRGVTSQPTLDRDSEHLYVMSVDANLFAFRMNWLKPSERWEWEKSPYQ